MESKPLLFPQPLRYTCQACGSCCRTLEAVATPQEVERFRHFDWAASRERFRGRDFMRQSPDGLYRLEHLNGACIFLDEDTKCAIHKELGYEAKPFMCKHFPLHLTDAPEGITVSFDFSCDAVVRDEGAPIESQEQEVRTRTAEWLTVGGELGKGMIGASLGGEAPQPMARRGVPLAWEDYLAIEDHLHQLMRQSAVPLTDRLLVLDRVIQAVGDRAATGSLQDWLTQNAREQWASLRSQGRPTVSPMRQRAVVAPVVGSIESGWNQRIGDQHSSSGRVGLALALVTARASIQMVTTPGTLDLARIQTVHLNQDDPSLTAALERYVIANVVRRSLVSGFSLLQGSRILALYVGTIRWYAVAQATMAGRDRVQASDFELAIQLVEKALSRSPSLKSPRFLRLLNLLFERVSAPATLYVSTQPE